MAEQELEAEHAPIISAVEIIVILAYLAIIDTAEIIVTFFGIDDFWIGDLAATPVTIYLWFRGVSAIRYAATQVLEFIPYVGNLPLLTIGFLLTVYLDRNPKQAAAIERLTPGRTKTAATVGAQIKSKTQIDPGGKDQPGPADSNPATAYSTNINSDSYEETPPIDESEKTVDSLSETETKIYGMPVEPLSEEEQAKIFETPNISEPNNSSKENVTIKGNEIDLKKSA